MQTVYKNEVERGVSRGTGIIDPVICAEKNSRHMERERNERVRIRRD